MIKETELTNDELLAVGQALRVYILTSYTILDDNRKRQLEWLARRFELCHSVIVKEYAEE